MKNIKKSRRFASEQRKLIKFNKNDDSLHKPVQIIIKIMQKTGLICRMILLMTNFQAKSQISRMLIPTHVLFMALRYSLYDIGLEVCYCLNWILLGQMLKPSVEVC